MFGDKQEFRVDDIGKNGGTRVDQSTQVKVQLNDPKQSIGKSLTFEPNFVGFTEQVSTLQEIVDLKQKSISKKEVSEFVSKIKISGILVHGPSGIGKTMLIRHVLSQKQLATQTLTIEPKDLIGKSGADLF